MRPPPQHPSHAAARARSAAAPAAPADPVRHRGTVAAGRAAPGHRQTTRFPCSPTRRRPTSPGSQYEQAETDVEWLKQMVSALRRIRSELGVSPAKAVTLLLQAGDAQRSRPHRALRIAVAVPQQTGGDRRHHRRSAAGSGGHGRRSEAVRAAGRPRRPRRRTRAPGQGDSSASKRELAKSQAKLASETFVQNAPAAVVEQERQRLADWSAQRDALSQQRARL